MEKSRGERVYAETETKTKTVDVADALKEITTNLLELADLAEELSKVPPERLKRLFEERQAELSEVLAYFGITRDDLKHGLTLN